VYNSNLYDSEGKEYDVFGHKLIFLNHNYLEDATPEGYRDWLVLVQESIKSPKNPQVNLANAGVKKVTQLIDYERLSPEERTASKNRNAAESAKKIYEQEAKLRERVEIARKLIKRNLTNEEIAEDTGLTIEQIEHLRNETE
jgi:hypothetical protein